MFARTKKSGRYQYLQIVENRREGSRVVQRVVATLGRLDRLRAKGDVVPLPGIPKRLCLSCRARVM